MHTTQIGTVNSQIDTTYTRKKVKTKCQYKKSSAKKYLLLEYNNRDSKTLEEEKQETSLRFRINALLMIDLA